MAFDRSKISPIFIQYTTIIQKLVHLNGIFLVLECIGISHMDVLEFCCRDILENWKCTGKCTEMYWNLKINIAGHPEGGNLKNWSYFIYS